MTLFNELIDEIIGIEGGYSDHKSDTGGKTRYGITEHVARSNGYTGAMQQLPLSMAKQIYKDEYWNKLMLGSIEQICPGIVRELLDTGINQGTGKAAEYLQVALNALNRQQADYADIRVDGSIGNQTLNALRSYTAKRGARGAAVLYKALNCLQGAFYITISQSRQANEDFVFGWLDNRVD